VDLKDRYARIVHGLDKQLVLLEHDINVFRKTLDMLEKRCENVRLGLLVDLDIHCDKTG
jgi:hypothetical protein